MNNKYTDQEIDAIILRYTVKGESVISIAAETGIPRSTIYTWIKSYREKSNDEKKVSVRNFFLLNNKVKRLEGIIEILKKSGCSVNAPLEIKLSALEALYGQYSVHMLCNALEVPRSTFYNYILRNKRDNTWYAKRREEFREIIQQIYEGNNQIFGSAKITAIMKERGYRVSTETVRNLMRDMGLISIRQDAKDYYDKEQRKFKNHLNQQFDVKSPNEVWVSDVTYYRLHNKNYYICAIIDLYARAIVGYKVGKVNSTNLVKSTFLLAYNNRNPGDNLIFHTDRGCNYRSKTFCSCLNEHNIKQSYSRAHIPYDNSVMESFFSSLKREELYRTKYRSENEFRTAVDYYMEFYNERRPHAKNGYKTPLSKESEFFSKQAAFPNISN